ncbi:hypothetical protein F5B22DRAFT_558455 [Xylaria bambusicola]|uniref:uncharacterized protein n=1 Tax=Xylaria bambusicola TaxID=326684 RepID=UPI0020079D2A|nr:uncharacterized protein F5B22DRAFT_558455 [Xylaria bambusicola]KAI0503237.1 hypothetical protein F5B22DRAFT_558455 [Xylaria bambusicola]
MSHRALDMAVESEFCDFIVVGGGAAGCALASGLARSKCRPRVSLLEAGSANSDPALRDLNNTFTQYNSNSQNWGYKSAPMPHVNNREICMDTGKGLGGSTAINFACWVRGPREEWDEIARVTGDDCWKWENVEPRFRRLENYHHLIKPGVGAERYCSHGPDAYGVSGPLHLTSQTTRWDTDMIQTADVWEACGYPLITDMSVGNYVGILFGPLSGHQGVRSTAADLLRGAPPNLKIETDSVVRKILVADGKAFGVELTNGKVLKCGKEVILSAGTLSSPQILMRSGIGPAHHLIELGIPIVYANENIGQNLRDHCHVQMHFSVNTNPRIPLYDGPPTGGAAMGFLKNQSALSSPEFHSLHESERQRLSLQTVPTFEVHHFAPAVRLEGMGPTSMMNIFLLNGQGLGEVKLQSLDPETPPIIRPIFLESEWDKRIVIESTQEALRIMDHSAASKSRDPKAVHICPKTNSEEDILDFWRENLTSTWHMTGTCRIGHTQDEDGACVDPDFRVYGIQNLRVVDLSVLPFLPSVHTQSYAYQVGMIAAEKLERQYGLGTDVSRSML